MITRADLEAFYGAELLSQLAGGGSVPAVDIDALITRIEDAYLPALQRMPWTEEKLKITLIRLVMYFLYESYSVRIQQTIQIPQTLVEAYQEVEKIINLNRYA